jgi:hypothetical protein
MNYATPLAVRLLFRILCTEHNLVGWRLEFSDRLPINWRAGSAVAGDCSLKHKRIRIAVGVLDLDWCAVRDTVRHEVAHALAIGSCGHDLLWARAAVKLGCRLKYEECPEALDALRQAKDELRRERACLREPITASRVGSPQRDYSPRLEKAYRAAR